MDKVNELSIGGTLYKIDGIIPVNINDIDNMCQSLDQGVYKVISDGVAIGILFITNIISPQQIVLTFIAPYKLENIAPGYGSAANITTLSDNIVIQKRHFVNTSWTAWESDSVSETVEDIQDQITAIMSDIDGIGDNIESILGDIQDIANSIDGHYTDGNFQPGVTKSVTIDGDTIYPNENGNVSLTGLIEDGKNAYEVWRDSDPANYDKDVYDYLEWLNGSGFETKAVQILPTGNDIDQHTIYAAPDAGSDPETWTEWVRNELNNDWIPLATHDGSGLSSTLSDIADLKSRNEPIVFTESKAMNAFIKTLYVDVSGYTGDTPILDLYAYFFRMSDYIYLALYNAATGGTAILPAEANNIAKGNGVYSRTLSNGIYYYIEVDESAFPDTTISNRAKLTSWAYSKANDPRSTDIGYTENVLVNKFIKSIYIDTSEYTGDVDALKNNLRLYGIWNRPTSTPIYYLGFYLLTDNVGQIQMHSSSVAPDTVLSKKQNITSKGSITINVIVDWESLEGYPIISSSYIRLSKKAFDPNFWYAQVRDDDKVTMIDIEKKFCSKVYTTNANANKVIRKLYIDTSGYTGAADLSEGVFMSLFVNDRQNMFGFQLKTIAKNDNDENVLIDNFWLDKTQSPDQSDAGLEKYTSKQTITKRGIFVYAEYNWDNWESSENVLGSIYLTSEAFHPINDPRKSIGFDQLSEAVTEAISSGGASGSMATPLTGGILGTCGDSITEGAGVTSELSNEDLNRPLSGVAKATFGYFIAKINGMSWHNYGISGSTLGDVTYNGKFLNGFSRANGRYTQLAANLTHITIFFGWNDDAHGNTMKREDWLKSTYGSTIYYPENTALIGTTHANGTPYATQEQYDACNSQTGTVNGIAYDSSNYWKAVYIGTPSDNTPTTFWGAWNIVLKYLIENYPLAKILLIVPYGTNALMRQTVRDAARRYGLCFFDFGKAEAQMFAHGWYDETISYGSIGSSTIRAFRNIYDGEHTLLHDYTHPDEEGYRYMYPAINAKLCSI